MGTVGGGRYGAEGAAQSLIWVVRGLDRCGEGRGRWR